MRAPETNSEDDIQKACVKMLQFLEGQGKLRFFSVPNEAKRSIKVAMRHKALGMRAGVPDLVVLGNKGSAGFIELKTDKGKLTASQKDWRDWLKSAGYPHAVCKSVDEMLGVLKAWGI